MKLDLVLCGVGGQGIIFAGRLLSWMALRRGWPVIGAETHGMAQRGGSVVAFLRFGPAAGPLLPAGAADALIAFKEEEAYRHLALLKPRGALVINAARFPWPEAAGYVKRNKIKGLGLEADRTALAHGLGRASNLILLGFACASGALPFSLEELERAVEAVTRPRFAAANLEAVALGAGKA